MRYRGKEDYATSEGENTVKPVKERLISAGSGRSGRLIHAAAGRFTMGYERRIMTLLLLALALDYGDRTLISALGPTLKRIFHLNNAEFGLLGASFVLVAAGASLPIGSLTDRTKRTLLFAVVLIVWVIAEGWTGAAVSFAMFFGVRLVLGIIAGTLGPTIPSLTGDLVPGSQWGRALGYITSGQLIGIAIGFILPVLLLSFTSWRWNFWVLAIGGAVLSVAFWRAREPERTGARGPGQSLSHEERRAEEERVKTEGQQIAEEQGVEPSPNAIIARNPIEMSIWDAARYALRIRTDVIVMVARSVGDFFFQGIGAFAVVFATGWYGISQSAADIAILVLGLGALIGVLLIGRIADILLRRGWLNSRLWLGALGYLLAPAALYPAFLTRSLTAAMPLFAIGAFLLAGAAPPLDAVRIDVLVPRLRGRAEAVRQTMRTAAEGGAPALIGAISGLLAGGNSTLGLERTFLIILPALIVNGLVLLIALRTYRPDTAAAVVSTERLLEREEWEPEQEEESSRS
jgi:predicted MFS family arabinose efflux permease